MNTETKTQEISARNFISPKAYLSRDEQWLTLVLPDNTIIRKHVNFFKSILKVPFVPKTKDQINQI